MLQKPNSVGLLPLFSQKQAHATEAGNVTIRATVCSRDALCDEGFRVLWHFGVVRFFFLTTPKMWDLFVGGVKSQFWSCGLFFLTIIEVI